MAESETFGASFKIDITNLKAGITQANRLIKESEAEFRAASVGIDNWSKSEEGLIQRQNSLTQQISIQKEKIRALIEEKERVIAKMQSEGKSQDEIARAIEGTNKQIDNEGKQLDRLQSSLDKTDKELDDTENSFNALTAATEKADKGFTVLKGALANLVADGFRKAIDAAKDFVSSMIEVGKTFDSSMAQVSAVSGATGDDLQKLRDKAKQMGETTKFTASEAADAFNYMAMAGWKTEEMLGGIDGILNLAAASGTDLATTSDIVTDALTAMGYKAQDAGRLADVMAAASSNANTNVEMMGLTFQYAAPLVGALGYTMEDTAVAIGLMANAGIKGEKAGTALRSMFTRLASPPKAAAGAMTALGLSLTDANGKMKPFSKVVEELRASFADLSETEQAQYASAIAGQEAMSGLLAIVNASPSDFNKLTKAVEKSEGAAQSMADTMIDNLGGDMTILNSQIDGVRLTLYEKFEPTLRNSIKSVQSWISKIDWNAFGNKATKALKSIITETKKFGENVLPTLKSALKIVGDVSKFAIDNFEVLATTVGTAIVVFKAFEAAMAVTTAITAAKTAIAGLEAGVGLATKAQTLWNAAMSANPIGAVITAVALLAGGIALLVASQNDATDATALLSDKQRDAVTATEEAAEAYKSAKEASEQLATAELANIDYTERLWGELKTLTDANGKVKEGYEGRAQYILNELNSALGTEYKMNGDIIESYEDISRSIDDVIEKKKAQILLEAYEDSYRQAIEKVSEAEKQRVEDLKILSEQQGVYSKKLEEYTAKEIEFRKKVADAKTESDYRKLASEASYLTNLKAGVDTEKTKLDELQGAYNTSEDTLYGYYQDIQSYETASTLAMQGDTEKAIGYLNNLGSGFKTAASTAKLSADEQKKILGQQVIDTEVNAQLMKKSYEQGVEGVTEEMVKTAQEQANQAKEEFLAVGGNITKGIAKGAEDEENTRWTLTGAMRNIINKALSAAQNAMDAHSPSKLFQKEAGRYIGQGIAVGIDDSTKDAVNSVKKQVRAIEDAYDLSGVSSSVDVGINSRSAKKASPSEATTQSNGGGVVVYQTNNYSQAHSRYELYKSKQQTAAAVRLAIQGV